ncbi:hypothetical protein BJX66DRAFT_340453 [Aspergillus keveii]|uniref:Uncharacterized protein n=1 Tax=Aspergillus keveii TaxID=714993 RepID=A0ABR4FY47_9EURO
MNVFIDSLTLTHLSRISKSTVKEFLNDWVGKTIHISAKDPPSTWTLEKKVSDKHVQVSAAEYHQRPGVSVVFAGFICRSVDDPKDVAFVRVFVQIPYAGSDWAIPAERARRASINLPWHGREELDNLQALSASADFVPGGFLHYILLERAQGVQLDEETFWAYSREERDAIREGFRNACCECMRAGVYGEQAALDHLFWDSETSKVIIAGWRVAAVDQPGTDAEWGATSGRFGV